MTLWDIHGTRLQGNLTIGASGPWDTVPVSSGLELSPSLCSFKLVCFQSWYPQLLNEGAAAIS